MRFICITDRQHERSDWEMVDVDSLPPEYREHPALRLRVEPHHALELICPERRWSLFIDRELLLVGDAGTVAATIGGAPLAVGLSMNANACSDTAMRALSGVRNSWGRSIQLAAQLDRFGWAETLSPDTRFLWRDRWDEGVDEFCRRWWLILETERWGTADPATLDLAFAAAIIAPVSSQPSPERSAPEPDGVSPSGVDLRELCIVNPNRRWRSIGHTRHGVVPITFLSLAGNRAEISTVLRGEQLSSIVSERFDGRYDVAYADDFEIRGRVVIVVKETIARLTPAQIADLSRRNVAVILAWDDRLPDRRRLAAADAHMLFSYRQLHELADICPQRPKFYVTQHVNLRFPEGRASHDTFRPAYFGRRDNTTIPPALASEIEMVDTPWGYDPGQQPWMRKLTEFNCHWAVRHLLIVDGGKPFMKGFVAAKYGAPIIVDRHEGDAAFYLGPDYPYYVDAQRDAQETFAFVRETFAGPIWDHARHVMDQVARQSSLDQVCRDFEVMISTITS